MSVTCCASSDSMQAYAPVRNPCLCQYIPNTPHAQSKSEDAIDLTIHPVYGRQHDKDGAGNKISRDLGEVEQDAQVSYRQQKIEAGHQAADTSTGRTCGKLLWLIKMNTKLSLRSCPEL